MAVESVVGLIDLRPREMRKVQGILRWYRWALAIGAVGIVVVAFHAALAALQSAWRTGEWEIDFFDQLLLLGVGIVQSMPLLLRAVLVPVARVTAKQVAGGAVALRLAAEARDTRLASHARELTEALEKEPVPALSASFGPFQRPNGDLASDKALAAAFLLLFGFLALAVAVIVGISSDDLTARLVIGVVCGVFGAGTSAWGVAFARQARSLRRPFRIEADELGLRWTRTYPGKRQNQVPWGEMRSIFIISYLRGLRTHYALVVDARSATLAWEVRAGDSDARLADSDRLTRLVLARTKLPLLDLSKAAELITTQRWKRSYADAAGIFKSPAPSGPPLWPEMPRPVSRRKLVAAVAACFLPLLLLPILYGVGAGLERYQMQQLTALLAQVRSHQPLFHDALAAPDGLWPLHDPSSQDANGYAYIGGAYVITPGETPDGQPAAVAEAYAPGMYRDMAVEVTVRQIGGDLSYGDIGLALHVVGIGAEVKFGISGDFWRVAHYDGCTSDDQRDDICGRFSSQNVSAIHREPRAANRLDAILRGNEVICFINDVYVGTFVDPLPQEGRVGFGSFLTGAPAAFSDFTIYPL
ncbi:MAG TPA: hypothetical protein VFU88_06990 [Ktedonobacterales bacterium]|nr:hypothetical protein [Ktedonobacterales bacterium]